MSKPATKTKMTLAERFWSLARAMEQKGDRDDPVSIVRHVLRVLDALDRGEQGSVVSVATVSFLKLLRESEIAGDLSYASPEQIRGEMVDERSLVFSVGVLLFERLTGRHPFGAEASGRRLSRISKVEFGSGVNYFPTVPGGLRHVLMRAMGPFPEERWEDLRQLRARLEQFVAHEVPAPYLPGTSKGRAPSFVDDGPTRVVDMQRVMLDRVKDRADTDPSAVQPKRPDSVSGETETATAQVETIAEPDLDEPVPHIHIKPRSRMLPIVWAGAGAAVASIVFFLLQTNPNATSTAAQNTTAPVVHDQTTKPTVTKTTVTQTKVTAPPKLATNNTVPPVTKPAPMPITVDPKTGTEHIAALLTPCFSKQRRAKTVRFGISILYGRKDGKVKTTYYSAKGVVTKNERQCIEMSLGRLIAKPRPKKIIGYNMLFHADGGTVRLL